ncbi:MAG: 30S ribosomal protein S27ae [Nanoarchaeota archaeon]|nr:30S ribosomal protein S27ae [Nanoarchaeota archaeon]|tara:strand:- start:969 stop:1154 length:186 start_codon:yes stop_codon:yes gene_type:complete
MAKKKVKNKKQSEIWKKYKVEGDKVTKSRYCQRCGPSSFLADHKDRYVCGKCGFVEVKKKE